jgi:hypothetical protein
LNLAAATQVLTVSSPPLWAELRLNFSHPSVFGWKLLRGTTMPRPDKDMRRMSELFAEARSIANRRGWPLIGRALDQAQTALLRVEPHDGEKGRVAYRPTFESYEPDSNE